jgi:hypothetical protein
MKQPGLDGRHRDTDGKIDQKHGNTLNKNLSQPIPQFPDNTTLADMRKATHQTSIADVRKAAANKSK